MVELREKRITKIKRKRKAKPKKQTTKETAPEKLKGFNDTLRVRADKLRDIQEKEAKAFAEPEADDAPINVQALLSVLDSSRLGRGIYAKFLADHAQGGEKYALSAMQIPRGTSPAGTYILMEHLLARPDTEAAARVMWDKYNA